MCRLVEFCEKTKLRGIVNPKSNAASLVNVNRAFQVLRNKQHMNEQLMWFAEDVVAGNQDVIISILTDMVKAYKIKPNPKPKAAPKTPKAKTPLKSAKVETTPKKAAPQPKPESILPEVAKEQPPIEQPRPITLVDLLFPPKPPPQAAVPDLPAEPSHSLEEWIPLCIGWLNSFRFSEGLLQDEHQVVLEMRSGVLLCDLVSSLEQKRILGIFRPPRTHSTSLSNIIKALTLLRANRSIHSPFLKYVPLDLDLTSAVPKMISVMERMLYLGCCMTYIGVPPAQVCTSSPQSSAETFSQR